eukprot:1157263-Pelagomonas_calceolata.AAC.16
MNAMNTKQTTCLLLCFLSYTDPDAACQQVCEACEILDESEVMRLSAKTGLGMEQVLPAIIE